MRWVSARLSWSSFGEDCHFSSSVRMATPTANRWMVRRSTENVVYVLADRGLDAFDVAAREQVVDPRWARVPRSGRTRSSIPDTETSV